MQQLQLLDPTDIIEDYWDTDSWETPIWLAQKMAGLLLPTDKRILEPAAGAGQIAQFLPRKIGYFVQCNELSQKRYERGIETVTPSQSFVWSCSDFLLWEEWQWFPFHVIITNPPFSFACEFIEKSLQLLDRSYEHARLLYLLPCDFFQSQERADYFNGLDCHIHHRHLIRGRVAYLKNGVPVNGRQLYDCVYDIRPGKVGASETYL